MYWFICSPCTIVLRYPEDPVFPPKGFVVGRDKDFPWLPRIPDPMGKPFGVDKPGLPGVTFHTDWI